MPPLRRLSSIAYARPGAGGIPDHHEVDGEAPEDALPRPAARRSAIAGLADQARVRRIGRERAAEVALAARAAEELIVGRQQLDAAVRARPQLHAGAEQLLADDPLLDDAAVALELGDVRVERHVLRLELHRPDALARSPPRRSGSGSVGDAVEVDQRVAGARDALVES